MSKKFELWLLFFWNVPAFVCSYAWGANYLATAAFFFVLPALYLTLRRPAAAKKVGAVAAVFSVPGTGILSYLAHKDGAWYNPSVVGLRIFDTYPIEDFLWAFLYFYYTILFYEYFFERERKLELPPKFTRYWEGAMLGTFTFSILAYLFPQYVQVPYFYLALVLVMLIGLPWTMLSRHQALIPKVVKTASFFWPLSILYEYVANVNGNWFFPGTHFIGYVELLGTRVPLEEFLWLFLTVPAVLCYYEFTADNER